MSFTKKLINVQFVLANGSFGAKGENTATISGLRVSCQIEATGGLSNSQASIAIYGLPLSLMNQLSTVGRDFGKMYQNSVTVEAGEEGGDMTLVFYGNIYSCYVDASAMPQVCLRVMAAPGRYYAMKPVPPVSIKGSADAAGIMSNLAGQMGFGFENAGVNVKLSNPYLPGTAWTQALSVARHGGFDMTIDRKIMAIVPPTKPRSGGAILISPDTGMVGYPQFNQAQVVITALFNPAVKHLGEIEVKSDLTSACGKWKVARLIYQLESLVPNGRWFMTMECIQIGAGIA